MGTVILQQEPPPEAALALLKQRLGLDGTTHLDAQLQEDVRAELDWIADYVEQVLLPSELVVTVADWDSAARLPHPVQAIHAIRYLDVQAAWQTVAEYRLQAGKTSTALLPAIRGSWPGLYPDPAAVEITLRAGYAAGSMPPQVWRFVRAVLGAAWDSKTRVTDDIRTPLLGLLDGLRRF